MASATSADASAVRGNEAVPRPMGRAIDWIVSLFLVLWGVAFAIGGYALFQLADLDRIAQWVADGVVTSTTMTDAELVDATFAMVWWGGIGLIVIGAVIAVTGIGYFVLRNRSRQHYESTGVATPDLPANAVLGATVTYVTAALPLSPVLGGAVTGYFAGSNPMEGARAGGIAGLVAAIPLALLFAFLGVGLASIGGGVGTFVVVVLALALVFSVGYFVALGAIGGFVGVTVADR